MGIFYKISALFMVLFVVILGLFNTFIDEHKVSLRITEQELNGVEFIQELQLLTINLERLNSLDNLKKGLKQKNLTQIISKDMLTNIVQINTNIDTLQSLQQYYPHFSSYALTQSLKTLKMVFDTKKEVDLQAFTGFESILKQLRTESYELGDKSNLLYEGEKKLNLLASIMTHYMPEFTGELAATRTAFLKSSPLNKPTKITLNS
jgi:hypothetical protein